MKSVCTVIFSVFALTLQGCSGFVASGALGSASLGLTPGGGSSGLEAFQSGFYTFANTQGCAQCHAAAVEPFFASTNIQTAYTQAKTLIDFSNPTASPFIANSGNAHCGIAVCESPTAPTEVTTLLTEWANAENSASNPTPQPSQGATAFVTATVSMPATIPTVTSKTAAAIINFQLSALTPAVASLSNAIFQIQVQMDNATTYKFTNPMIGGNTAAVTISGIHIFIRPSGSTGIGTEGSAPSNAWDALTNLSAAVFAVTTTTPTTALKATPLTTQDLFVPEQSAADSITIGFDSVQ